MPGQHLNAERVARGHSDGLQPKSLVAGAALGRRAGSWDQLSRSHCALVNPPLA